MKPNRIGLLLVACAACANPLLAKEAAKAAPAPAAVPPEQAQLDYFVGQWHCNGTAFASPMGPEHKTTAMLRASKAVGDRWLHITYDEDKSAQNPTPYHAGLYLGYDAGKKTIVSNCYDVMGGHCSESGTGWNGDALVLEGTAEGDGNTTPVRETLTRKGPNELVHSGEMQGPDKKWAKVDEETCKK